MKFSANWLREFVDLPKNQEEIADLLTRAGVETENIQTRGAKIDNVVVSQITASSRHPNADRLTVCEVDDASGTKRQIVCGATNYKVRDRVPLALPGAKLPNGTEIRKSKLRGVESEGMLCSPIELGLGDDASGLLILPPDAKIGTPIGDLFPEDTILDVEITPNRGDLLSHFGLAREIAALTGKKLKSTPRESKIAIKKTGVTITATRECPFFSARKIDNVKVGPSPQWLRTKIESVGIRSINNIVDVSNFVMLELGQPTHAFDADKLTGDINVRLARDGEKFLALDGKTYSLKPDNLVVADQERAVGIGGVMGGEETGVTDSTKNILLEGAYFLPASIRRTARNLNLPSDASYRFERGVDPEMILRASQRASELIQEIAGGTPAKEINLAGKLPPNPADVSLSYDKCDRVVGTSIKPKAIDEILTGFGLKKTSAAKTTKWKIPSYRRDLQRDVDLIEEVVRAYGAEKIPGTNRSRFTPSSAADDSHDLESAFRERLSAQHWRLQQNYRLDFFDLKGAIESLALPGISFRRGDHADLSVATEIFSNERAIGFLGQLREGKVDAPGAAFVAEFDLDLALRGAHLQKTFREIEKFPSVTRDIAMIVPNEISHEKILRTIEEPREPLLERVDLFDLFRTNVGAARKSLAYRLTYRDRSRTLTNEEVNSAHAKRHARLRRELGAELRE